MEIQIEHDAWCEHCGDLEPFDPMYDDGGTKWCLDCAEYDDEFKETYNDNDVVDAWKKAYKAKIKHFKKRIKECEEMLAND